MILLRKMHSHVWNTFILSAILFSSCCPPPVDDEVYINIYQNMSIETTPVENVTDTLSLIHISEPTRQAEISYAVFCLKKKNVCRLLIEKQKEDKN